MLNTRLEGLVDVENGAILINKHDPMTKLTLTLTKNLVKDFLQIMKLSIVLNIVLRKCSSKEKYFKFQHLIHAS